MLYPASFAEIASEYDGFILDLWGVIHDGVTPYAGAAEALRALAPKPVLLLSNAPRRAHAAQKMLRRMGITDDFYSAILTSGEACFTGLAAREDPFFARLGNRVFFIGPERDRNLLEGLDLIEVTAPAEASFVLNTGPDDERDPTDMAAFLPVLRECCAAGLPMLCANPDLVVIRGGTKILCAGALAVAYEQMGGEMRMIGKPFAAIYDTAFAMLDMPPSRVLAVGDSLRTDIAGAKRAGLDAVLIAHGVDAPAIGPIFAADAQERAAARTKFEALAADLPIRAVLPRFA